MPSHSTGGATKQPKRDTRIVFYLNTQEAACLNGAVTESGMERPDWLRTAVERALTGAAASTPADTPEAQAALAAAQARIDGLEALIEQQRERQGMSDSLNQELNQRLKEAHALSDRFQLALPAAGETRRSWWQFWQTSSPVQSG